MERTYANHPTPINNSCDKMTTQTQPDIIDLFNMINDRMDILGDKIGQKLNKVINMID